MGTPGAKEHFRHLHFSGSWISDILLVQRWGVWSMLMNLTSEPLDVASVAMLVVWSLPHRVHH